LSPPVSLLLLLNLVASHEPGDRSAGHRPGQLASNRIPRAVPGGRRSGAWDGDKLSPPLNPSGVAHNGFQKSWFEPPYVGSYIQDPGGAGNQNGGGKFPPPLAFNISII